MRSKFLLAILLSLSIFRIVACKKDAEIEKPPTPTETPVAEAIKTVCPFSINPPLATWEMKNGKKLVVCPSGDTESVSESHFKGWVNIYPDPANTENGYIKLVDSELPDWLFTFGIQKKNDQTIEITQYSNDSKIASQELDCSKDNCALTTQKCLGLLKVKPNQEVLKKFKSIIDKKSKDINPDESDVNNLFEAALAGNKQALKYVLDYTYADLNLDGASASGYEQTQTEVKRLVDIRCIRR